MKKKFSLLIISSTLCLGAIATTSALTSCETKKAVYQITLNQVSGVTLSSDVLEASEGDAVTITLANLQKGKRVKGLTSDQEVEFTKVNDTTYTFIMIKGEVSISCELEDIYYSILVNEVEGVELEVIKESIGGEEVTINVKKVPVGKHLKEFSVVGNVTIEKSNESTYKFIMPFENVTLTPTLENSIYSVSKDETNGAKITLSSSDAIYEANIDVEVEAPKGKKVDSVLVNDTLEATKVSEGKYKFSMPDSDVTVKAVLVDATFSGTINLNKNVGYDVKVKNENNEELALKESENGYTFTFIADFNYSLTITNFDSDIYNPSVTLNGTDLVKVENSFTFTATREDLTFNVLDNVIEHNLNYASDDISVENNLTKASKGSLVKFTLKEKAGLNATDALVYTGTKDGEDYVEISTQYDEETLTYSFTMGVSDVTIEASYEAKKVELNFESNSISYRQAITNTYLLKDGKESYVYFNAKNKFDYGNTYRVYLNDIVVKDKDAKSHTKFLFKRFKFNGEELTLNDADATKDKYYVEFTILEDVNTMEILGEERPAIDSKLVIDRQEAVNFEIYTDENLSEESKSEGYYFNKTHYVKVEPNEGYKITKIEFSYYKYSSSSYGYANKEKVVIKPTINGNVYSFDTKSNQFEHYCEITCTITTQKVVNYEGKAFVGEWGGVNIYNANTNDQSLKGLEEGNKYTINADGSVYRRSNQLFIADGIDETNGYLYDITHEIGIDKYSLQYASKTGMGIYNSTLTDRNILVKIPEGKTTNDFKASSLLFGGSDNKSYGVTQFFINSEEGFVPYSAVYWDNIQNVVYLDVELEFLSGTNLGNADSKVFNVKKDEQIITIIKNDSTGSNIVDPSALVERTINTSGVTGCTLTPSSTKGYAGDKIALTISEISDDKRIDKVLANGVECTLESANVYSFIVPASDVEITVTYKDVRYITVNEVEGATVSADVFKAIEGEVVNISVSDVQAGKAVDRITVTGTSGSVEVSGSKKNFSFVMPNEDVTISVTLKDAPVASVPFASKTYSGTRTWTDYYYGDDDSYPYTVYENFEVTFNENGTSATVKGSSKEDSYTTDSFEKIGAVTYTEPTTEGEKGIITIKLDDSTTLTVKYDVENDTVIVDDFTYKGHTYYYHNTSFGVK